MSSFTFSSRLARLAEDQRSLALYFGALVLLAALAFPVLKTLPWHLGVFVLKGVGELVPVPELVTRQLGTQALYGSAFFEDEPAYKFELVTRRKPQVLALGSSRALQLRQEFFGASFVNAGRAMNDVEGGRRFAERLLPQHKPELVLITIDLWWFNPRRVHRGAEDRNLADPSAAVSTFWAYVQDRRVPLLAVTRALSGNPSNPISSSPAIGLAALVRGNGFRPDGSRDYGDRYFGRDKGFDDFRFADSLRRVRRGQTLLAHGADIDESRIQELAGIVSQFQAAGSRVVLVLPPLASTVLRSIEAAGERYAYIPKARAALQTLPAPVFDFTDPASLGASDCEFADGLHGGDVVAQRMLLQLVERGALEPDLVDPVLLRSNIATFAGRALSPVGGQRYRFEETDFLGLGCRKPPLRPF